MCPSGFWKLRILPLLAVQGRVTVQRTWAVSTPRALTEVDQLHYKSWGWKQNIYAGNWTVWYRASVAPAVSDSLQCPACLQMCCGKLVVGVTEVAQQPAPLVCTARPFLTVWGSKDCFFLHIQKLPVPNFLLPWATQQLRVWGGITHAQQEAGLGHHLLWREPRRVEAAPAGSSHWVLCLQWVLPLSTGFHCDFSVTWPGACSLALVGPCSAENRRLFLLNGAVNYLHYLHIATYWLQHCKVPY